MNRRLLVGITVLIALVVFGGGTCNSSDRPWFRQPLASEQDGLRQSFHNCPAHRMKIL